MTSKLTREKAQWLHDACEEAAAAGIKLTMNPNELLMFTSYVLAAMDSKPVAWTDEAELRDVDRGGCGYLFTVNPVTPHADERRIILLYRHAQQPAAVVLEEMTADGIIDMHECGYVEGWNACRAAMLAASQHDTPALNSLQSVVTVPGKWIPVSERVPDDRTQVILWDAEIGEVTSGHYSHKTQTFYHCGDAIENEITHWMPLPAAPQEVK